eukprot:443977_1
MASKTRTKSRNNKCHPIYIQCALIYSNSNIYSTNGIFFCDLSNSVEIEMDILFIAKCIPEIEMLLLFMCRLYSVVSTRTDLSVHESVTLSVTLSTNCISENIKNSSSNDKSHNKQLMKLHPYVLGTPTLQHDNVNVNTNINGKKDN